MAGPGSRRSKSYDENIFTMGMQERTILKSQIEPMLGRLNRSFPGKCWSLIWVNISQIISISNEPYHKVLMAKWPIMTSFNWCLKCIFLEISHFLLIPICSKCSCSMSHAEYYMRQKSASSTAVYQGLKLKNCRVKLHNR